MSSDTPGVGPWLQQEAPDQTNRALADFIGKLQAPMPIGRNTR